MTCPNTSATCADKYCDAHGVYGAAAQAAAKVHDDEPVIEIIEDPAAPSGEPIADQPDAFTSAEATLQAGLAEYRDLCHVCGLETGVRLRDVTAYVRALQLTADELAAKLAAALPPEARPTAPELPAEPHAEPPPAPPRTP